MKHGALVAIAALALTGLVIGEADAAKLGGGRSLGAPRPSVAPRAATPPASTPSGAASQPVMPPKPVPKEETEADWIRRRKAELTRRIEKRTRGRWKISA